MIEPDLIETLRKKSREFHEKQISWEWSHFTQVIRGILLREADRGKNRVNFPLEHTENVTRAKEYLEKFGFAVGTYSNITGRGITISF